MTSTMLLNCDRSHNGNPNNPNFLTERPAKAQIVKHVLHAWPRCKRRKNRIKKLISENLSGNKESIAYPAVIIFT